MATGEKASGNNCLGASGTFFSAVDSIGVGTGGAIGAMPPPQFSAKIILEIFPFFLKHNFYTENDSPGRGKHKSA